MTCFLFDAPRAVFIHIPKTAGTSVQAMWDAPPMRRCYGHIPEDWQDALKFAVVRHPETRFLSALRMFKHGSSGADGSGELSRMPDLDIDQALDILENPRVSYDRIQRTLKGNLKHHLLPQTHPFNCLHLADHIFRQETLDQDIAGLALDGLAPLPQLRQTNETVDALVLSPSQRKRIHRV